MLLPWDMNGYIQRPTKTNIKLFVSLEYSFVSCSIFYFRPSRAGTRILLKNDERIVDGKFQQGGEREAQLPQRVLCKWENDYRALRNGRPVETTCQLAGSLENGLSKVWQLPQRGWWNLPSDEIRTDEQDKSRIVQIIRRSSLVLRRLETSIWGQCCLRNRDDTQPAGESFPKDNGRN